MLRDVLVSYCFTMSQISWPNIQNLNPFLTCPMCQKPFLFSNKISGLMHHISIHYWDELSFQLFISLVGVPPCSLILSASWFFWSRNYCQIYTFHASGSVLCYEFSQFVSSVLTGGSLISPAHLSIITLSAKSLPSTQMLPWHIGIRQFSHFRSVNKDTLQ